MAHQQMTNQLTLFRHGSFQRLLIHSSIQKWHPNLEFGKEIEASKPESVESENVNMWNLAKIFENNVDIVTMPQEIAQMTTGNFTSIIRRLVTYYTMQNQNRNIALCKVTNYPCKVTTKCYTVQNNQSVNLLFEAFPSCPAQFRDACKVCLKLCCPAQFRDAYKVYLSKVVLRRSEVFSLRKNYSGQCNSLYTPYSFVR